MNKILLLVLVLSGCATATKLNTGEGEIYRVECDGTAIPMSACFTKANNVCPKGWDQIGQDGSIIPQAAATPQIVIVGAIERKSITVKCR